jgi:hypothetical protein
MLRRIVAILVATLFVVSSSAAVCGAGHGRCADHEDACAAADPCGDPEPAAHDEPAAADTGRTRDAPVNQAPAAPCLTSDHGYRDTGSPRVPDMLAEIFVPPKVA